MLWAGLIVLAAAGVTAAFLPGMHLWGMNGPRFLPAAIVWPAWLVIALALVPVTATRGAPLLGAAGDAIAKHGPVALLVAALSGAALAYAMPDRVRFVGDFLLRQGTIEEQASVGTLFPQALPLDVLLHYDLPLAMSRAGFGDANGAARLVGAIEAGMLAALAVGFARVLGLAGVAAACAAGIVFFGGYLAMFTGYSKAFAELVVLFAAAGVFGLAAIRGARRTAGSAGAWALLAMGACVTVALALHRSAPALLPAFVLACALHVHARGRRGMGDLRVLAALALPLAVAVLLGPRIVRTVARIDAVHFTPPEVVAAGGPLAAAFAGTRGLDLVNLVLLLSPLALLVPFVASAAWRRVRGAGFSFLIVLVLPCALVWPFLHPVGGMHRDWDDFTFGAVVFSLLAAWVTAAALDGEAEAAGARRGAHAWLAVAALAVAVVPSLQWLYLHSQPDAGIARVHAFVAEPPQRATPERARTWDYLGTIRFQQERWRESAAAFEQAALAAPSPRMLQQWAAAETQAGDFRKAQRIYWRVLEKDSLNASAWLGLGAVSSRFGDIHESRRGALRTLELDPGNETALAMLRYLESLPQAMRDSLARLYPPRP